MAGLGLVLGGARSGKSAFAEELVETVAQARGLEMIYVATARSAWDGKPDPEFLARIDAHRARRGSRWTTIEAPDALEQAIAARDGDDRIFLIDCLTLWLSNRLLESERPERADLDGAFDTLRAALRRLRAPAVLVSNEVGLGLVPETALGRRFRDGQGQLNRLVARDCQLAVFVAAGLPLTLKGDLTDWAKQGPGAR